jgi:hypothetical protein
MSYFPILKAPYCSGQTTLYNFSPNNWEFFDKSEKYISLTYLKDEEWHSEILDVLKYQQCSVINFEDISEKLPVDSLPLLSLSSSPLVKISKDLPMPVISTTAVPNYRASLSLISKFSTTNYQGEIDPFPPQASLLTFAPFLQYGENVENFLLLLNIEKQATTRESVVEIYDSSNFELKSTFPACNNNINIIPLDSLGFDKDSLPVVICRTMAAIPLYFSCANKGKFLSLEHTHPPASLVVHGNRFAAQKYLKDYWFSQCQIS